MAAVEVNAYAQELEDNPPLWVSRDLLREELLEVGDGICTAVLIDSINILTAGHCFRHATDLAAEFQVGGNPAKIVKISPELDLAWLFYPTQTRHLTDLEIRPPRKREAVFTDKGIGRWGGETSFGYITKFKGLDQLFETSTFIVAGKSGSGIYATSDGALVGIVIRCQPTAINRKRHECIAGYGNIAVPGDVLLRFLERQ